MQCSFFYKERLLSTQQSAKSGASTFFSRLPSLMAADKPYPQLQPSLPTASQGIQGLPKATQRLHDHWSLVIDQRLPRDLDEKNTNNKVAFQLGTVWILRKNIGAGRWFRKWQFLLLSYVLKISSICNWFKKVPKTSLHNSKKAPYTILSLFTGESFTSIIVKYYLEFVKEWMNNPEYNRWSTS